MTTETPYVDPMTAETLPVEAFPEQHGWLEPGEITLDTAMIRLGDAGFAVTHFPEGFRAVEAEVSLGVHHARVSLVEGRYWLVEQQASEDDGRRIVVEEWWPETVVAAVDLAVELVAKLKAAHDEEQQPAAIAEEVADAMATAEAGAA